MHIPDGYLSPSTCATLYAFAAAGWYAAVRRIRRVWATRTIPLISVFAAFSFVIMMFNIPLPGGTSGHAVGIGVATIVLGPWGSILAISIALAIQALFFGDGGITTLGANCFNMAIIGSLTAWGVYQLVAANSKLGSRRRAAAAAVAGYISINAAALATAFEFGIQPILFRDATGAPLYAPYPLHIAIPAMMIGHSTIAGLAEAAISAGLVSYLQGTDVGLLRGGKSLIPEPLPNVLQAQRSEGRLWLATVLLMLLTPLGILAAGTAWGEWSAKELQKGRGSVQVTGISPDHAPPSSVPAGLQKLSTVWTAPFPGYAPGFVKHPALGYLLSAMFVVGLFLLASRLTMTIRKRWRERELRA